MIYLIVKAWEKPNNIFFNILNSHSSRSLQIMSHRYDFHAPVNARPFGRPKLVHAYQGSWFLEQKVHGSIPTRKSRLFQVYNTRFLDMVGFVDTTLQMSIERFSPEAKNAIRIWNVFLPKPDVPPAIAANYRQVWQARYCPSACLSALLMTSQF